MHSTKYIQFLSPRRVIATQLCPKLTKSLILTDPFRIKTTAETIPVNFHVPVGCQLIVVYIPVRHYEELRAHTRRVEPFTKPKSVDPNAANGSYQINTSVFPFQFKKKMMKRDKSIVFTNIPEECAMSVSLEADANPRGSVEQANSEDGGKPSKPTFGPSRPNHLPLRFKNITSKDIPESGFSSSITFDERDSYPHFIGRTSVCSTPMTENKVLHGNILPICVATGQLAIGQEESIATPLPEVQNEEPSPIFYEKPPRPKGFPNKPVDLSHNYIVRPFEIRRYSFSDIRDTIKKFSKHILLMTSGVDYMRMQSHAAAVREMDCDSDFIDDNSPVEKYRTLCDPVFPLFNRSGAPISQYLFEKYLAQHRKQAQDYLDDIQATIDREAEQARALEAIELPDEPVRSSKPEKAIAFEQTLGNEKKSRKALSLPLKSLNSDSLRGGGNKAGPILESKEMIDGGSVASTILDPIAQRRKLSGLQLTPLITKLSILAMNEERSSGFSSWDTTPGIELATPIDGVKLFRRQSSTKLEEVDLTDASAPKISTEDEPMQRVELFICGQNNMTMFLLLEDNSQVKKDLVHNMVSTIKFINKHKCM